MDLNTKIYWCLMNLPEFKNLSMDRQGEVVLQVERMIEVNPKYAVKFADGRFNIYKKYVPKDDVIYDESGFGSGVGIGDPILKKDEWDYENDKVGC